MKNANKELNFIDYLTAKSLRTISPPVKTPQFVPILRNAH